jgi:biopolymer transport protein TolQ
VTSVAKLSQQKELESVVVVGVFGVNMAFAGVIGEGTSFWTLLTSSVKASSAIENLILLLLLVCSIASWAIVLWKLRVISAARAGNRQLNSAFESSSAGVLNHPYDKMTASPNVLIYEAAVVPLRRLAGSAGAGGRAGGRLSQRIELAMEHASRIEFGRMHRGMDILASIASATPFIGLFGTVLGIMSTFQVLGTAKSASLNVVAPGIAAALIATAAGLAVAIPAVFLYNWLMARMDEIQEQADMFIEVMGQLLISAGVMEPMPAGGHAHSHNAAEPIIVGSGAHVPGAAE